MVAFYVNYFLALHRSKLGVRKLNPQHRGSRLKGIFITPEDSFSPFVLFNINEHHSFPVLEPLWAHSHHVFGICQCNPSGYLDKLISSYTSARPWQSHRGL